MGDPTRVAVTSIPRRRYFAESELAGKLLYRRLPSDTALQPGASDGQERSREASSAGSEGPGHEPGTSRRSGERTQPGRAGRTGRGQGAAEARQGPVRRQTFETRRGVRIGVPSRASTLMSGTLPPRQVPTCAKPGGRSFRRSRGPRGTPAGHPVPFREQSAPHREGGSDVALRRSRKIRRKRDSLREIARSAILNHPQASPLLIRALPPGFGLASPDPLRLPGRPYP